MGLSTVEKPTEERVLTHDQVEPPTSGRTCLFALLFKEIQKYFPFLVKGVRNICRQSLYD